MSRMLAWGWVAGGWVASALLLGCGGSLPGEGDDDHTAQGSQPIVNGTPTNGDPAVVYIDVGCSGTLVTPRIVLTACHCLQGAYGHPDVFFGSDINSSGTWIATVHHAVYPGACVGDGDLAMLTLAQDGPAAPIPVGDRDLGQHLGEPVRVVGFGVTGENAGGSGLKREGPTVLGDVDPGVMYCDPTIQSGTCYGDSGGPNFMIFEGQQYVVGTTSYGTQACGSGWDASARTDAHYDWITQYIADQDPTDCGADGACASFCPSPDPDCPCAADGFCTHACVDWHSDPDCLGCGQDGNCRDDCPSLNLDCCAADGHCAPACGDQDPDCGGGGEGGGSSSSSSGNGSSSSSGNGSSSSSGAPQDEDDAVTSSDNGALVGSVACGLGGPRPGTPDDGTPDNGLRWPVALSCLLWLLAGRRRRRQLRPAANRG